jgi:hypothetical protein
MNTLPVSYLSPPYHPCLLYPHPYPYPHLLPCLRQCLELGWIAILVVGLAIVIFVTLMCAHYYNRLF